MFKSTLEHLVSVYHHPGKPVCRFSCDARASPLVVRRTCTIHGVAVRTWDAIERAKAETSALRDSEEALPRHR